MTSDQADLDWQPVLVAAGGSRRFGRANKLLALIGDIPVAVHSLRMLVSVPAPYPPIAVVSPAVRSVLSRWAARDGMRGLVLVAGGPRRRDSVAAAMKIARGEYVAVHDGARPLATPALLGQLLQRAAGHPGAVPGLPLTDSVASVDGDNRVTAQLRRDELRAIQTPQVVQRAAWLEAAALDEADATDDASMLLRLGLSCVVVPGERTNLKLTEPEDLVMLRALAGEVSECSE